MSIRLLLLLAALLAAAPCLAQQELPQAPASARGNNCSGGPEPCRTVGPPGDFCDLNSIQAAINTPGVDTVHVVAGVYAENLVITNKAVRLSGGYANCVDAINGNPPTGITTVAPASGRALDISQTNTQYLGVQIDHFLLSGNTNLDGAGIRFIGNPAAMPRNAELTLANSTVRNNPAANPGDGGGIRVDTADLNVLSSRVVGNRASFGGGIWCRNSRVTVGASAQIGESGSGNTAAFGAGLYIGGGCTAYVPGRVAYNVAQFSGGGAYVVGGGVIATGPSSGTGRAEFFANRANTGDTANAGGGAIYAVGSGTLVDVSNTVFSFNRAGSNSGANNAVGGAIAVRNGADLAVRRLASPCWNEIACIDFVLNADALRGTAIYAETEGQVRIADTLFRDQTAAAAATVVEIVRTAGSSTVQNSYFHTNGRAAAPLGDVLRFSGGAAVLRNSVLADNIYTGAALATQGTALEVLGVNLWQPGRTKLDWSSPAPVVRCGHADEALSVWPAGAVSTSSGDPIFRRRGSDYRVHARNGSRYSAIVDRCLATHLQDSTGAGAPATDAAGGLRLIDLAVFPNNPGPIDIGPQEVTDSTGDLIFRSGLDPDD